MEDVADCDAVLREGFLKQLASVFGGVVDSDFDGSFLTLNRDGSGDFDEIVCETSFGNDVFFGRFGGCFYMIDQLTIREALLDACRSESIAGWVRSDDDVNTVVIDA